MMWAGSVVGLVFGLMHAVYVYRVVLGTAGEANSGRAAYFAGWTLILWVLAGTYVLTLWLCGIVLYLIFKVFR